MDRTCSFLHWVRRERQSESARPWCVLFLIRQIGPLWPLTIKRRMSTFMPLAPIHSQTPCWKLWPAERRWWRQQWAEFRSKSRTDGRGSWCPRVMLNRWLTDSRNSYQIVILGRAWACGRLKSWPSNLTLTSKQLPILPDTSSSCMSDPLSAWQGRIDVRCLTVDQLPLPPPGKTGWPWTEESPRLAETTPNGKVWPRVSVITPSYNQGQFIEETIRSVLLQGYPNLEYMIIDGGSTDESLEIIRKYEPWLASFVSEPDRGQTHAINKGWMRATGEILAYINTDDCYLNGAIATAAHEFCTRPDVGMVYGTATIVNERNKWTTWKARPFDLKMMLTV